MIRSLLCSAALAIVPVFASRAAEMPPAPTIPAVDGVDLMVVTRTAKLREALAAAGSPAELPTEGPFHRAANPLPDLPDEAISSVVSATTGNGAVVYRLVSLTKTLSMDEFLAAAGIGPLAGPGEFRQNHDKLGGLDHWTTCRQFSPREYLITERFGPETLSQPAKTLSAMRVEAAKANCLVLVSCSGESMKAGLAGSLTAGEQVSGATLGLLQADTLRLFGRVMAGTPAIAAKLSQLGGQYLPLPRPGTNGPAPVLAAEGNTAGFDIVFSGDSASRFLRFTGSILADTEKAKARRTAHDIVSVYRSGRAAGCEQLDAAKTIDEIFTLTRAGTSPSRGPFKGTVFQFDTGRDIDHLAAVYGYLEMKDGNLLYRSYGARATPALPRSDDDFQPPEKLVADAKKAKARHNAQYACSVFASAMAAGTTQMDKVNSVESALTAMMSGVTGSGQFSNSHFKLNFSKDEAKEAAALMKWDGRQQTLTFGAPK